MAKRSGKSSRKLFREARIALSEWTIDETHRSLMTVVLPLMAGPKQSEPIADGFDPVGTYFKPQIDVRSLFSSVPLGPL